MPLAGWLYVVTAACYLLPVAAELSRTVSVLRPTLAVARVVVTDGSGYQARCWCGVQQRLPRVVAVGREDEKWLWGCSL